MKTLVYYRENKPAVADNNALFFQYQQTWGHPSGGYGKLDNIASLKPHEKKLRFYHSYWSKPALTANRWQIRNQHYLSIIYTAISVYCLKALGQEIVLHTDKAGAELLGCLPYDKVYIDLENNDCPINFWASGKFLSVKNGETGIHIDTDLFITDQKTIDVLADNDYVITHFEKTAAYKNVVNDYLKVFKIFNIAHPFNEDMPTSVNCGIVKLPENFKKLYVEAYFNFVNEFTKNQHLKDMSSIEHQSLYAPDLLIEQLLLKKLLELEKIVPTAILEDGPMIMGGYRHESICHLLSFEKYILVPFMLKWLKKYAPDYLERINSKFKELEFNLSIY